MRLFVYGMQSSGASTFARTLAERPGCLALVDIPNNYAAPRVTTRKDFVAKAVITTAYPLAVHVERFRPDKTVLLLRDPIVNYESLKTKNYRHYSGLMDEKFLALDAVFAQRDAFDAVIHYEDFTARDTAVETVMADLGWPINKAHYTFSRSYDELLGCLWDEEPQLRENMEVVFGASRGGEVRLGAQAAATNPETALMVERLCPRLAAHYRRRSPPTP